jgi:hypothetical protein
VEIALLVALIAYFAWQWARAFRQRADEQRRAEGRELEGSLGRESVQRWKLTEKSPGMLVSWTIDFPEMRLTLETGASSSASRVRRVSATRWEQKETERSRKARRRELEGEADESMRAALEDLSADLSKPAEWCPIDEDHVSSIETAYQRYLRATE